MHLRRSSLAVFILAIFLTLTNLPVISVQADTNIQMEDVAVFHEFGGLVTFQGRILTDQDIQSVFLSIQPAGQSIRLVEITPSAQGEILVQMDSDLLALRAFTMVFFWFEITSGGGEKWTSDTYHFSYIDNRFDWETLEATNLQVNWHDRDRNFGQDILNVAQQALDTVPSLVQANIPNPVIIYVYRDPADLQSALSLVQQSWVAGHANPDLGIILLSIPDSPSQRMELERQIPHELMHLLLYQKTVDSYTSLPAWLKEGLASIAEFYPNPDYPRALDKAIHSNGLIPLNQLCSAFPSDASGAFLAYAQSASFVQYLYNQVGTPGVVNLLNAYDNGFGCEEGFKSTFGISLTDYEMRWRQESLGMDVAGLAWRNFGPYILIGLALLGFPLAVGIISIWKRRNRVPSEG